LFPGTAKVGGRQPSVLRVCGFFFCLCMALILYIFLGVMADSGVG